METVWKPVHQIKVGDVVAYYQGEVDPLFRLPHHREGLYSATVLAKGYDHLELTIGRLSPRSQYRVVISKDHFDRETNYKLPPREKGKTIRGVCIE